MLSLVSNTATRRVASNIRLTSSISGRRGWTLSTPVARRSFSSVGDNQQQQQHQQGGNANEEEPSSGIWGKLLLATGLIAFGAGTYTYVSWDKLYPDTPFPIPLPELPASIRAHLPHAPKTAAQLTSASTSASAATLTSTSSSSSSADTSKATTDDNVEDHTTAVHTKPEENFLAEPKSAAILLPEIIEEQQRHVSHHHDHQQQTHEVSTPLTTPTSQQPETTTTTTSEEAQSQSDATPATPIAPQVHAVVTETIASELAANLASESPEEATKHAAQIAEIQPQIEEAAAQAASGVAALFGEQSQEGGEQANEGASTEQAAVDISTEDTTPAAKVYTQEELDALLASQRDEIMEQTAHFLRGWGEQQATISNLKDRLLETKEELERVEREYEERIQELQEQNTHQINRIRFEATTEKLSAVEDAIKEGEYLCELKNAKLHEQRVKQIADVYQRVLQLNANLNNNYASQGEQHRQQICLALVDTLLALQQNKSQLKQELHRLFELSRNREDILEALHQIPDGFVSGADLVQSREHLKKRFGYVQQVARTQALVPDDGGLWWQLGASLASRLLSPIQPSATPLEGQSQAESVLAKAAYYLEQDDLAAAVAEVEKLR
eukprot:TRINITY_DN262_c0_g1_i2.p2 TRINITY_DN262_c0_g1~~TRINITY_DN262_c0_g1_i2.p2  ORF type:complete len:614 (-),score=219.44 TRINITY_DN262_c0_g1_i2:2446-4287(-)